jgi:hypothetical protein
MVGRSRWLVVKVRKANVSAVGNQAILDLINNAIMVSGTKDQFHSLPSETKVTPTDRFRLASSCLAALANSSARVPRGRRQP